MKSSPSLELAQYSGCRVTSHVISALVRPGGALRRLARVKGSRSRCTLPSNPRFDRSGKVHFQLLHNAVPKTSFGVRFGRSFEHCLHVLVRVFLS